MRASTFAAAAALAVLPSVGKAQAPVTVSLGAVDDVTLYQASFGGLANGAGRGFFTGTTGQGLIRRALIRFDIAANVPAGAVITSATMRLRQTRTVNGTDTVSVYRVANSWGEGTSDAGGQEGTGSGAEDNDATWTFRFYDRIAWQNAGGDFDPTPRAATAVTGTFTTFSWASAMMTADVQSWLAQPETNFGWMLRGSENMGNSARRFDSHESTTPTNRPQLVITYVIPAPSVAGLALVGLGFASRRRRTIRR